MEMTMKKLIGSAVAIFGLSLFLTTSPAQAVAVLGFDDVLVQGGTVSYAGGAAAAAGSGILFDQISGTGTPLNNGVVLGCSQCTLNFSTGANTFNSPALWTWGGGGSVSLTGIAYVESGNAVGLDALDTLVAGTIGNPVNLVSGVFSGAVAIAGGGQLNFSGLGNDTKHQGLLDFYGLTSNDFNFANTEISSSNLSIDPQTNAFTGSVNNADFNNTNNPPAVPEPSTVILLGSGLVGLAAWRMRKRTV